MKINNNLSVLISVYKKEKPENLDRALYSVINQSLAPDEIILVEDGELNDGLYNVINNYEKKYKGKFKVIKSSRNLGLGKALNLGLKNCSCDYVARMDSDDYSSYNRFEKEMSILKNKKIDVIGSLIDEYDEDMKVFVSKKVVPENHREIVDYAKKRNPVNHVSVIFKKDSVMRAGGYIDCLFFEDYYLWVRMIENGSIFYNIQESLVNVRGGLEMINRRGGIKYCKSIINFNKIIFRLGFIRRYEYCRNVFVRMIVSLSPNIIRQGFYKKILRKNES